MGLLSIIEEGLSERLSKWEIPLEKIRKGIRYLKYYGYLKEKLSEMTLDEVIEAVKEFQKMARLPDIDGEMGPKTLGAMEWPRCGHTDALSMRTEAMQWGRKDLTYFIERRDSDLSAQEWDDAIHQAFTQWSDVADLKFTRVNSSNNANMIMSVGSGSRDGFDGPGGTLAWAQLPPRRGYQGQLLSRFDTGETWRVGSPTQRGIMLLNVACHEIGHLLGLEHSRVDSALMAPFYSPNVSKPQRNDDVSRIVNLYGASNGPTDPLPPADVPAPTNLTASHIEGESDRVLLNWNDNSTGEDAFEIYRNDVLQGSVGRGWTRAIDAQVPEGSHKYKVRAIKNGVASAYSNIASITLGNPTPDPDPDPEPDPDPTVTNIELTGDIQEINIPGYNVEKIN